MEFSVLSSLPAVERVNIVQAFTFHHQSHYPSRYFLAHDDPGDKPEWDCNPLLEYFNTTRLSGGPNLPFITTPSVKRPASTLGSNEIIKPRSLQELRQPLCDSNRSFHVMRELQLRLHLLSCRFERTMFFPGAQPCNTPTFIC